MQVSKIVRNSAVAMGLLLSTGAVMADAPQTPAALTGASVVTAEQAKKMFDAGVPVIDVRVANEFVTEHIKGAINVPYKEKSAKAADFDAQLDRFELSKLPADKTKPVIFYCNGGECWKSYKASTVAIRDGYKKVHWLRDGINAWKEKGLPVE